MSAGSPALTGGILEAFRTGLQTAGAPLGHGIEPGLSDAEIDALEQSLGLALPPELRTLWSWGTPSTTAVDPRAGGWDINPHYELWPVPVAAEATRLLHSLRPELKGYIVFAGEPGGAELVVEGGAAATLSPVTMALDDDPGTPIAAPSMGALFALWADQLAARAYRFSGEEWASLDGPLPFIPHP